MSSVAEEEEGYERGYDDGGGEAESETELRGRGKSLGRRKGGDGCC